MIKKILAALFALTLTLGVSAANANHNDNDVRVDLLLKDGSHRTVALYNPGTGTFSARTAPRRQGQAVYANLTAFVQTLHDRTRPQDSLFGKVTVVVDPRTRGVQVVDLNQIDTVSLVSVH